MKPRIYATRRVQNWYGYNCAGWDWWVEIDGQYAGGPYLGWHTAMRVLQIRLEDRAER